MIKAVIFDMDGVLVDSTEIHTAAHNSVLVKYGYNLKDVPADVFSGIIGRPVLNSCQLFVEYFKLPLSAEEYYRERQEYFFGNIKMIKQMEGAADLVKSLKDAGYKTAIATSGVKEYVEVVLDHLNIRSVIDVFVSSDNLEKPKPDPDIYLKTAAKLNVRPAECVVIEDSKHGVEAAKNAGMKCVGIEEGEVEGQDISRADVIVKNMKTLNLNVIKKLEDD